MSARARSIWKSIRSSGRRNGRRRSAFLNAEMREIGLRQIDAILRPVDGDVLPEIDQLQRRANAVGTTQIIVTGTPDEMQHQPSDRVGRTAAVVEQFA